jgi:glycosyltransferase involved in cell wall biosynthesis
LKIGIVDDHNIYSTTVYTPPLFRKMSDEGNDVICYCPKYRASEKSPIPVKNLWGPFSFPFSLFKALRNDRREIVLIPLEQQTFGANPISLLLVPFFLGLCRLGKMRILINLQGLIPLSSFRDSYAKLLPETKILWWIAKGFCELVYPLIFRLANEIQVFSEGFGDAVLEYGDFFDKLVCVSAGVEEKELPRTTGDYFLAFGFVAPRKGLEYLVKAWQNINADLIIAGRTDKDPVYAMKIKRLAGGDSRITFIENVSNEYAEKLVCQAKALIFPYVYCDSISGPLLMAQSYKKPILASDIGIFHDTPGAILFEPANYNAIIQAVKRFQSS